MSALVLLPRTPICFVPNQTEQPWLPFGFHCLGFVFDSGQGFIIVADLRIVSPLLTICRIQYRQLRPWCPEGVQTRYLQRQRLHAFGSLLLSQQQCCTVWGR
jgi:hypothetical protein